MVTREDFYKFTQKETRSFYFTLTSTYEWIIKFEDMLPTEFVSVILTTLNSYSTIVSNLNWAVKRMLVPTYIYALEEAKAAAAANLNKLQCLWALLHQFHKYN